MLEGVKTVDLVALDRDHPGFRDVAYRARRNEIASLAEAWSPGEPPPHIAYDARENGVWKTALAELRPLHRRFACAAFEAGLVTVDFPDDAIPSFDHVNERLAPRTGFRLAPVAGLASPAEFMGALADGVFFATQYVRHHSAPLYTPEPDVLHELIGHAALLADETYAGLNRAFGEATRRASPAEIEALIRVYWYTLEFGVVGRPSDYRVVGAGLLSSFGELGRFEAEAEKRVFDLDVISRTPFDPTDYQRVLFVAETEADLTTRLRAWLDRIGR